MHDIKGKVAETHTYATNSSKRLENRSEGPLILLVLVTQKHLLTISTFGKGKPSKSTNAYAQCSRFTQKKTLELLGVFRV